MKSDDRFTMFAVIGAVFVTIAVFFWSHPGLVNVTQDSEAVITTAIPEIVPAPVRKASTIPVETATAASNEDARGVGDVVFATFEEPIRCENDFADFVTAVAEGRESGYFALPEMNEVLVRINRDGRTVVADGTCRRYTDFVRDLDILDFNQLASALEFQPEELRIAFFDGIEHLLKTPVAEEDPDMESKGSHWGFADPDFESLSSAQKHLLLMGRSNARVVRTKLVEMQHAFGRFSSVPVAFDREHLLLADSQVSSEDVHISIEP